MIATGLFLAGLVLSVFTYVFAATALAVHRRRARGERLPGFSPAVSILKPLSGLDEGLEENLESFYRLDYLDYEIIFSFARREDPAFAVARRVADRHPEISTLFVVDAREPGGNAKVNRLAAAFRRARHRLLLLSDGNVRVRPDFLGRAVSWFAQPRVGLVSHLFRAVGARSLGSRLESLHLNGALQAGTATLAGVFRSPCVVGKSILVSRDALDSIGGFAALRDYLAEDYLIGQFVERAGFRVVLSSDEIETTEFSKTLRSVWSRQRRWAILRRRLGGVSYGGELLASPLPWAVGAILAGGGATGVTAAALTLYVTRLLAEAISAADCRRPLRVAEALLLPIRDAGVAALFWGGLLGRRTSWRGRSLRVGERTLIRRETPKPYLYKSFLGCQNKIRLSTKIT
ncbi:MAG TPA: glycosyltransferase [Thermoanaerobaculia bacterium]